MEMHGMPNRETAHAYVWLLSSDRYYTALMRDGSHAGGVVGLERRLQIYLEVLRREVLERRADDYTLEFILGLGSADRVDCRLLAARMLGVDPGVLDPAYGLYTTRGTEPHHQPRLHAQPTAATTSNHHHVVLPLPRNRR